MTLLKHFLFAVTLLMLVGEAQFHGGFGGYGGYGGYGGFRNGFYSTSGRYFRVGNRLRFSAMVAGCSYMNNPGDLTFLLRLNQTRSLSQRCFVKCVMEGSGMMTPYQNINPTGLRTVASYLAPTCPGLLTIAGNAADQCQTESAGFRTGRRCDTASRAQLCLLRKLRESGYIQSLNPDVPTVPPQPIADGSAIPDMSELQSILANLSLVISNLKQVPVNVSIALANGAIPSQATPAVSQAIKNIGLIVGVPTVSAINVTENVTSTTSSTTQSTTTSTTQSTTTSTTQPTSSTTGASANLVATVSTSPTNTASSTASTDPTAMTSPTSTTTGKSVHHHHHYQRRTKNKYYQL